MPASASVCLGELVVAAADGHEHSGTAPCGSQDCPGEAPGHSHPNLAAPAEIGFAEPPGGVSELEAMVPFSRMPSAVVPIFTPPKVVRSISA